MKYTRGRAAGARAFRRMWDLPEPTERRTLDFEAASRELAALTGHWVGVELSHLTGSGVSLTLGGPLARSWTFGRRPKRSQAFVVGEASMRIGESAFARGILERYRDGCSGLEWRLVAIELRIGLLVEVEEIPTGPDR